MTQRTRYFLIGSVLVVVAGLCTGLVAYYNGSFMGRAAETSDFTYIASDTTAVAYADVRAIMNSEFRQKLRQFLPTGDEKNRIQQETGVDIEHDIDTVLAGFSGNDPSNGGAFVILRGRFDDARIETTAVQHGAKVEQYQGKRMLVLTEGSHARHAAPGAIEAGGTHGMALAFLEPGCLAMGDVRSVRRALDTSASKTDITKDADLMKLVNDVRGGNNAWVVSRFDEISKSESIPEQVKQHLPAVQFLAVSAHVNGGVNGMLRAQTRDEQSAQDLKAVVGGALAAGRLLAGEDKRAASVMNSLQVGGADKTVTLAFTLPTEILDVLNGVAAAKRLTEGGVRK
jgi:hypothetical protein